MKVITVEELAVLAKYEVERGNGKKKIMLSDDDEGNGYHAMFYAFSKVSDIGLGEKFAPSAPKDAEEHPEDWIVLG